MVMLKLTPYSTGTASREYSQSIHIGCRHEKWLIVVEIEVVGGSRCDAAQWVSDTECTGYCHVSTVPWGPMIMPSTEQQTRAFITNNVIYRQLVSDGRFNRPVTL
jgi:hypothetical protein